MSPPEQVDFGAIPWEFGPTGIRYKAASRGGRRMRLVELERTDTEHDWCVTGHVGFVLEGKLEIAFEDRTELLVAGSGFFIRSGEDERHRPRAVSSRVRLLLVEDE